MPAILLACWLLGEPARPKACAGADGAPEPYRGLRAELNTAEAVLRIRATGVRALDSPAPSLETPPLCQEVTAVVKRTLAGRLAGLDERVSLTFAAARHHRRLPSLPRFADDIQFWNGPQEGRDQSALVKRDGDDLVLLNLLGASDGSGTDALLTAYAAAARRDDGEFTLWLAGIIADWVELSADRLLWGGWGWVALDDWGRLPPLPPPYQPRLLRIVARTHRTVVGQIDAWTKGGKNGFNVYELPWLVRLLPLEQRRQMAAALLRAYAVIEREVAAAKAEEEALPPLPRDPPGVITDRFPGRWAQAEAYRYHLLEALSKCVDPEASSLTTNGADILRKARALAAGMAPR